MIICGPCKGQGVIKNVSVFSLPAECSRCNGTGQIMLKDLWPGDHAILLYTDSAEQLSLTTEFIAQGLKKDECCVVAMDEGRTEKVREALVQSGVDVESQTARDALLMLTVNDAYLEGGSFVPEQAVQKLLALQRSAASDGFKALRITGEGSWAMSNPEHSDTFMRYEAMVDEHFKQYRPKVIALCQYDQTRYSSHTLLPLMRLHGPVALV